MTAIARERMPRKRKAPDLESFSGRLAHRIRTLREKRGWDVERLSKEIEKAGYIAAVPTIYHWENGTNQPALDALPFIAKALDITVRVLVPKE